MAWGMKNRIICLFGSSIMEGRIGVDDPADRWYNLLQVMLSRAFPETCFPIVNSAVGGESTREIMDRLDRDVLAYKPDYCLFMIGGNNDDPHNPARTLAPGELARLADIFAAKIPEETKVIGAVLNPVVDAWHFATKDPAYENYRALFGGSLDACLNPERDFARAFYAKHGWPCVDLYALMADDPGRYMLRQDGIHLTPAGHALFAKHMFDCIQAYA